MLNGVAFGVPADVASHSQSHKQLDSMSGTTDAALFEAPQELICPITQAVFFDPVLTSAGHAYERRAIEHYLEHNNTDPLSREPLLNKALTPVYVLRSRALEYRETTARICVERACMCGHGSDPVRYLRRAGELCSDAGFWPPCLTKDVVDYLQSHQSNAYDRVALEIFARSLYDNGYRDRAASVFFYLLSTEHDRSQQAHLLRRCVACWQEENTNNAVQLLECHGDNGIENGALEISDTHVFEKLIQLLDRQLPVSWLIDVASEAGLGDDFVAKLCEHVLFPPLLGSSSRVRWPGSAPKDSNGGEVSLSWEAEKELLLKYTYVLTSSLKKAQRHMLKRVEKLEFVGSDGVSENTLNALNTAAREDLSSQRWKVAGGIRDGAGRWAMISDIMRHPCVVAPWAAVAVLGDVQHPGVRALLVLPFAVLLPFSGDRNTALRGRQVKSSSNLGKL